MAKADGNVTRDEVIEHREVFQIPDTAVSQAAHVFKLDRQDVLEFELYARNISRMFDSGNLVIRVLFEGLFYIAISNGQYHTNKNAFLE